MRKTLLLIVAVVLGFSSQAQLLPNSSFENWETLQGGSNAYDEPNDWNSANECSELLGVQSVSQSTDAHSGASSAKLETMPTILPGIIVNGVVTTATMICDPTNPGQTGGYAFNTRPDSLICWVKYAPVDTDNGYVQVIMFNAAGDTIAYEKNDFLTALPNWTRIATKINWMNGDNPVQASVLFNSSWGNGNEGQGHVGSILHVDDVGWDTPAPNGISETEAALWDVYPNPVIGEMIVERSENTLGKIQILDITGRSVLNKKLETIKTKIDVADFPAGIYLYQLTTDSKEVVKTGKLLVNP